MLKPEQRIREICEDDVRHLITDTPGYKNFTRIEPVNKGWSSDKKYYIETAKGEKLLLRIADISEYQHKKEEFESMQKVAAQGIPMSVPINFGTCNNGKSVYSLFVWIDGEEAGEVLPSLTPQEQYQLGVASGQLLAKIHSFPAPKEQESWETRFNRKASIKIEKYKSCGIKIDHDDKIIDYIEENRHLLANRPQSFQHGDYHVGNMIISANKELSVIDFNRFDYGDPWEEFNRIVWCAGVSPHFATGRIKGYFNDNPPLEFFRLLALYISSNTLSSIYWAIPFGEVEIDTMIRQAKDVVDWYEGMTNPVPKWYMDHLS